MKISRLAIGIGAIALCMLIETLFGYLGIGITIGLILYTTYQTTKKPE